jgi:hypothetical protein
MILSLFILFLVCNNDLRLISSNWVLIEGFEPYFKVY